MKRRLIITIIFGILFWTIWFVSNLDPQSGNILGLCPFLGGPMLLGLPVIAAWNIVGIFRLWKKYTMKALIPIALCIAFFCTSGTVSTIGLNLRIKHFLSQLQQYESIVQAIGDGSIKTNSQFKVEEQESRLLIWLPEESRHLGGLVTAEEDNGQILTVTFLIATTINSHHDMYVYREDGDLDAASRVSHSSIQKVINEHWCAASN